MARDGATHLFLRYPSHRQWRWRIGAALLVLLLWGVVNGARRIHAQGTTATVTVADYAAELATALEQIRATPTVDSAQAIQQRLSKIKHVTLADNSTIDLLPILGSETAQLPAVAEVEARLALALHQLERAANDDTPARLALLEAIFARPVFSEQESLWQRFWRWLRSWLPDLSGNNSAQPNSWMALGAYGIGYLVIGVGSLLLIYLLSLWLQNLLGGFIGGDNKGRRLTPDGELLNAAEARTQAQQLARSGSYREAVRRLYLSALLTLDERSVLHYDHSNTNREVLATVRNNPTLYRHLQPVVETFDDVWYGVHEPDQSTFDRYQTAVEQLEEDAQ